MSFTKTIRQLLISTVLTLTCQTGNAQELQAVRSHYSTEDGLCSNTISMLRQDDMGYIWIATWNGLSRYDGYHFYNYKTGNGSRIKNLHNRLRDLVIDQSQNIWMHMYDNRVFVLDRATDQIINPFEKYKGHEEFRTIYPLLVTSTGKVLVSINDGHLYVMELDRKGLKSNQIATNGLTITSMVEGYQNDIWLGTDKGIRRLNRTNLKVERNTILPNERIASLHANGFNIYVATANGAIYSFVYGKEPKLIRHPTGISIFSLFVDSKGLLWFCDDRMGASRLNPETGNEKLFQQNVLMPEYDGRSGSFSEINGLVWILMNHGGYGYYNREQDVVEYFHNDPSTPWSLSNTLSSALELEEGVVWEATSRRGLDKLEIQKNDIIRKKLVANPTGPRDNEIRAMFYDAQRKLLLLGNKNSTLFLKYDNGIESIITHDSQGHPLGRLYGITKGAKGNYWICSKDSGLYKMSPNGSGWTLERYSHHEGNKQSLSSNKAYLAVEDKDGNLWVATYGGGVNMMKIEAGEPVFFYPGNGMKGYPEGTHNNVRTIATDGEGNVWAGTSDGILILSYKNKKMKIDKLKMPESSDKMLMSNDIVCIRRDSKGTMWVGTNGGGIGYTIGKDEDGTWLFDTFETKDGLPSDEIRSITFDERGNAWFATEQAICSFDPNKKIFTNFSSLDGLGEAIISESGAICAANGDVLFGTLDGYYVVDRKKLMGNSALQMKLQITDFFINEVLQSPRLNNTYDYYIPTSKSVELPTGNDNFAFRFAAMNYQLQHHVHYQYMLEGYDKDWQNADKELTAFYSGVPAGTYTFKVKAFLQESPDKYDLRTIEVIVPNTLLLSPTAFTIYLAVLLLAAIFVFVKYRKASKALQDNQ
ncbi:MAG: hypothetical protein IJ618_07775 [Prevotella sp.]|nr:hypothetical protein [Prevotella sp.]